MRLRASAILSSPFEVARHEHKCPLIPPPPHTLPPARSKVVLPARLEPTKWNPPFSSLARVSSGAANADETEQTSREFPMHRRATAPRQSWTVPATLQFVELH
jgi:hypothetical protein